MSQFLIVDVFKQSAVVPFHNMKGFWGSVGVTLLSYGIMILLLYMLFSGQTIDMAGLASGDPTAIEAALKGVSGLSLFFTVIILWIFSAGIMALIFNYWVRHAALGAGQGLALPAGEMLKLGAINALKFIGVGIVLGISFAIIGMVLGLILATLGLLDLEGMSSPENALSVGMIGFQVLLGVGVCFVYAIMSSSLTKTALGSDHKKVANPHANDFAVVLMLIYIPVILLSTTLPALFGLVLGTSASMLISLWSTLAIASAHGVRYKRCLALEAETAE